MKWTVFFGLLIIISCLIKCSSHESIRQDKIQCYSESLKTLKEEKIYKQVMDKFADTFRIMKLDKRNFGLPEIVNSKIDDAIFFNKDRTKCLLIVLHKNNNRFVFGNARVISGTLRHGQWIFEPSIHYSYDKDFFEKYTENSFENISLLARYSVLKEGRIEKDGCKIDEYFWFNYLTK